MTDSCFDLLDDLEKHYGVISGRATYGDKVSTGVLMLDIALGGGLIGGGWYVLAGVESSGKSTACTHITSGLVNAGVETIIHWDAEGSGGEEYSANIFGVDDMDAIYGCRGEDGKWVKKAKVRYYRRSILEEFFDFTSKFLSSLPDKQYNAEAKKWYLVYDGTRENKAKYKGKYSAALYKETGRLYLEAKDGKPQAAIILDSYPALLPRNIDESGEADKALAFLARAYAQHVPRIAGKLSQKMVCMIGVNQLREKPMVRFGNPMYEGCGNALKFASGCRLWLQTRAVPHGKGQFEEETSVESEGAGVDLYRYTLAKATKNKYATPNLDGWLRLWVKDVNGDGRGIDPVWDCFQYLKLTGQLGEGGTMNKIRLNFGKYAKEQSRVVRWLEFKKLVMLDIHGDTKALKAYCTKLKLHPTRIRRHCVTQMRSGLGWDLFFENTLNVL